MPQSRIVPVCLAAIALLLAAILHAGPVDNAVLFGVGLGLGLVLYRAAFGFTSGYRAWQTERRGAGLRAQLVMLALACALFFPVLAAGQVFGRPVGGFVVPAGVAVAAGAALFGAGMQLGGGCGSGTLFALGGGSSRMVLTLAGFIAGSVAGVATQPFWLALPAPPAFSVIAAFGWPAALAGNLVVLGLIWYGSLWWERRRHGTAAPLPRALLVGGLALAVLNFGVLAVAGHPWGITFAFALWGGKILDLGGISVPNLDISGAILTDSTSITNFGIILGALLAAALAGRFHPETRIRMRPALAAILGGLAMGYGARLASGCNIGAFVGGVVSGSPHGWLWIVAALMGSWVGIRLRPAFRL